jgi:hypothetical protein
MSRDARDRRDGPDPRDAPDAGARGDDSASRASEDPHAALLTAYVDGVAELPSDERRRVEALLASDPDARTDAAAVQALLDRLRALPPGGAGDDEPDWAAMERSIHRTVADEVPRPWWRRWRWVVPAMTCATAAAVLLAIWPRAGQVTMIERPPIDPRPSHHDAEQGSGREPAPGDGMVALWLDGDEVDVDLSAADLLGDVLGDAVPGAGPSRIGDPGDGDGDEVDLLPATDLAWVDNLDAAALDRAERWLARKKG